MWNSKNLGTQIFVIQCININLSLGHIRSIKNLGPIGPAVWTFIGYKETDKQSKYIDTRFWAVLIRLSNINKPFASKLKFKGPLRIPQLSHCIIYIYWFRCCLNIKNLRVFSSRHLYSRRLTGNITCFYKGIFQGRLLNDNFPSGNFPNVQFPKG